MKRHLVVLACVSLFVLSGCSTITGGGACREGDDIPAPTVSSGDVEVEAPFGTAQVCSSKYGMSHGHGMVDPRDPTILHATDEVRIEASKSLKMKATWDGADFTAQGKGTYVAPLPPSGCHSLKMILTDPDSDNTTDFVVTVAVGDVDCTPPPPITTFRMLDMSPTAVEVGVGQSVDVEVVIDVVNPPDGFFCPRAEQVSGVTLDQISFPRGCTAGGYNDATLRVSGQVAGEATIEVTAHADDGTAAEGSALVTVTVKP